MKSANDSEYEDNAAGLIFDLGLELALWDGVSIADIANKIYFDRKVEFIGEDKFKIKRDDNV